MSRAEPAGSPDTDPDEREPEPLRRLSLPGALRRAATDFYYHSVRVVPANIVWGLALLVLGWVGIAGGLAFVALGVPLLAVPLVGVYRLAGHIVRGEEVVLSDAFSAMRQRFAISLGFGAVLSWATLLLVTNMSIGFGADSAIGWAFGTMAGWGLVVAIGFSVVVWPLVADPSRRTASARETAKLAGLVLLFAPWRVAALALIVLAVLLVSTVAFAALVTIAIAYVALLSARVVLPEAERAAERFAARAR